MFSWLFLLTLMPTWLVAMVLLGFLRRRQRELEQQRAALPVVAKR